MEQYKVAIVEDDAAAAGRLAEFVKRYANEHGVKIDCAVFTDAVFFLSGYKPQYDCIFMDIDLPFINGMDGAVRLRRVDPVVPIVFVTSLARYAIRGYEVSAVDYLVKPYSYEALAMSIKRAISRAEGIRRDSVIVRNIEGAFHISFNSIYYVEVRRHRLLYHTDTRVVDVRGSMPDAVKLCPAQSFCKCGASWLINLKHVRAIEGDYVIVGSDSIKISRAYKKSFVSALHKFIEEGGGG